MDTSSNVYDTQRGEKLNKLGRRCVDAYQLLFCPDQIAGFRMTASYIIDQTVNGLDGTSIDGLIGTDHTTDRDPRV